MSDFQAGDICGYYNSVGIGYRLLVSRGQQCCEHPTMCSAMSAANNDAAQKPSILWRVRNPALYPVNFGEIPLKVIIFNS